MKYIKYYLYAALMLVSLSCKIKDPVEGIEVRLNTIARETLVTAYIYDASNGNSISQNVNITFVGVNAQNIVDETNDPKTIFAFKDGFCNFAIKDGITIDENNPFKVVAKVQSQGYMDIEIPVVLTAKGKQGVTFFLAKQEDFSNEITSTTMQTGDAGTNGTVKDTVKTTSSNGTEVTIPSGTNMTTSTGDPLKGGLTTTVTTTYYDENTSGMQQPNGSVGNGEVIAPVLTVKVEIRDNSGNVATNLSQPVLANIPINQSITNPGTGNSLQAGDSIPIWYLNTNGDYERSYPSAYLSSSSQGLHKKSYAKDAPLTLHALIKFINSYLGFTAPECKPKFVIDNPRSGYSLQVFFGTNVPVLGFMNAPIAYSGQVSSDVISIHPEHFPNLNYTVSFKYGANPADGSGGFTFASIPWSTSSCGVPTHVTFEYPQESIQANVKITGVCTSRDPIVRAYPTITFLYREKGTNTWMSGSLSNGEGVISGLKPNTTYEATTTYRDKEASVEIQVNSATNFEIRAGENQGSLLRAEVTGTSVENGISYVNLQIDIDLKDDCD